MCPCQDITRDLPNAFQWGLRLHRLHLNRISFPKHLHLLHSSRNLVGLHLQEAFEPLHPSIEALTDALSGMDQLQSLSLHCSSTTNYVFPPSPPNQRVVLPALTRLLFGGIAKYLERFVVRIDAPRLRDIQVRVLDEPIFYLSGLGNFIDRIEIHKSHHEAHILASAHAISISLPQPGTPTCFKFTLFSEQLSNQQSVVFRIIPHFSAFFLNVEDLRISATQPKTQRSSREDSISSRSGDGQELSIHSQG